MFITHFGVTTGIVSEFIANASKTDRVNRELRMPSMFSHSARSCMSDSVATPPALSSSGSIGPAALGQRDGRGRPSMRSL